MKIDFKTISKTVSHSFLKDEMDFLSFFGGSELPEIGISTLPTRVGPEVEVTNSRFIGFL